MQSDVFWVCCRLVGMTPSLGLAVLDASLELPGWKRLEEVREQRGMVLFAPTAAILISIVLKDIMGCSGGKLIYICSLGIP